MTNVNYQGFKWYLEDDNEITIVAGNSSHSNEESVETEVYLDEDTLIEMLKTVREGRGVVVEEDDDQDWLG